MFQPEQKKNNTRWWDLLAAILLSAAVLTSASRLVATKWVANLSLVQNVAILGTIAGLALGKSRFPRWLVALFAIDYGLYVIPWQLGLTMPAGIGWSHSDDCAKYPESAGCAGQPLFPDDDGINLLVV